MIDIEFFEYNFFNYNELPCKVASNISKKITLWLDLNDAKSIPENCFKSILNKEINKYLNRFTLNKKREIMEPIYFNYLNHDFSKSNFTIYMADIKWVVIYNRCDERVKRLLNIIYENGKMKNVWWNKCCICDEDIMQDDTLFIDGYPYCKKCYRSKNRPTLEEVKKISDAKYEIADKFKEENLKR